MPRDVSPNKRSPTPAPEAVLLRSREAARILGVSENHLFRASAEGRAPKPVKCGGRATRWRRKELEDWCAAGCPPCGEEPAQPTRRGKGKAKPTNEGPAAVIPGPEAKAAPAESPVESLCEQEVKMLEEAATEAQAEMAEGQAAGT